LLSLGLLLGMAWGVLHFWIVPRISDYRPTLERLAGQSIGVPVRIGQLTAESTGWDTVSEHQIPAWLVTVARCAFGAGLEPVNLAIHQDFLWWLEACCTHCIDELRLWWCDEFFWWWCPRSTEHFGEVSHVSPPACLP
jgi:hypothetical protein